ncbi:hypothetical protein [Clostridium sp.]
MCKVISLKSRNQLGGNDYKKNDELASRKGDYIGMLPLTVAKELRELQANLNMEEIQINQLVEEFDEHYKQYLYEIGTTLKKYNYVTNSFNPETKQLLIGEDGHMWVVNNSDLNVK